MPAWSPARRTMSWVLLVGGAAVVVVSLVNGFTSDPHSGEGWGGGVTVAVFGGGPLLAVGAALRSPRQVVARWTLRAASAAAAVATFVLVMQALDEHETVANQVITSLVLVAFVLAAVVELPLATKRWAGGGRRHE